MTGTSYTQDGVTYHLDGAERMHREDGPAVIYPDGARQWWRHGQPHRLDGPAVETAATHPQPVAAGAWQLDGSPCGPGPVVRAWLREHHPETPDPVADTLTELCLTWRPGTRLGQLYAAALAAHRR